MHEGGDGVGTIERVEVGMRQRPFVEDVHAAPIEISARADRPDVVAAKAQFGHLSGERGIDPRPADLARQQPGGIEVKIAHDFGLNAEAVLTVPERVERIDLPQFRPMPRRLAVRGRRDDQPDHPLGAPAGGPEFISQPVEQLRMRRRFAPRAEVIGVRTSPSPNRRIHN